MADTKEGVLRYDFVGYDFAGELTIFENDDTSDIGLYDFISKYILENGKGCTDRAKVKIEAEDGKITITRLALWGFDEEKQALDWIEDK